MASSSTYGEYIDMSLTYAGNENYSLSTNYCFDLVNNARHMRDVRSQYRVQFIGAGEYTNCGGTASWYDSIFYNGTTSTYQHCITQIYPWTMSQKGGPVTPVLRIVGQALSTGNFFYVAAYMLAHSHTIGLGTETSYYDEGRAWRWTGSTQTETIGNIIADEGDNNTEDTAFINEAQSWAYAAFQTRDIDADDNTNFFTTPIYLYRLSIYCKGRGKINAISLREYNE